MKQGSASSSKTASTKVEPISRAVSPAAVSELGIHQVRTTSVPLYEGRGLSAPMVGTTIHHNGSQGKHK